MNGGARMRIALAAAALIGALSLAACGQGGGAGGSKGAQSASGESGGGGGLFGLGGQNREETVARGGGGPSIEDLTRALENANPGRPIVAAALNQCREGR